MLGCGQLRLDGKVVSLCWLRRRHGPSPVWLSILYDRSEQRRKARLTILELRIGVNERATSVLSACRRVDLAVPDYELCCLVRIGARLHRHGDSMHTYLRWRRIWLDVLEYCVLV